MALPKKLQSALWSYNLVDLDPRRDRELIITQILNHGSWNQVKWLTSQYQWPEIEDVVRSPQRGSWMPDVLNYWTTIFDLKLDKKVYQKALFSLDPK
jgi:hypothetical protein